MPNNLFRLPPSAIVLSENGTSAPKKIQVIRTGTFHQASGKKFEITKDTLLSMKKNFDAKVRGIDIALDYSHESEDEAAAWFRELELSEDGTQLWAVTDWTPDGEKAVLSKKFRYVSADLNFDYQDNESLKKHGPTLLGAGLTNRPVVKGQAPVIQLAEGKGSEMDPKDQEIADLKKKISELEAKLAGGEMGEKAKIAAMEADMKAKDAQLSEAKQKLADVEKEKATSARKTIFDTKLSEGTVVEAQRESFMANDMDKFLSLAEPVKLKAKGSGAPVDDSADDVEDEILALAEKAVTEKRAENIVAATSLVLSENADLAKRYASK